MIASSSVLKVLLICILGTFVTACCGSSGLRKDEMVIIFPTSAYLNADKNWVLPIHHWVFEKEESDISRKLDQKMFSEVLESLGASEDQANSALT